MKLGSRIYPDQKDNQKGAQDHRLHGQLSFGPQFGPGNLLRGSLSQYLFGSHRKGVEDHRQ